MQRVLALSLLLAGVTLLPSCAGVNSNPNVEKSLDTIKRSRKLKVGYIVFPPCITKDTKTGKLGGHYVATVEEIARQAGWTAEYVETDWSTFAAGLATGRFDVSIAPTFVTIPRSLSVAFTQPLFYAGNSAIIRRNDNRFHSIGDADRPDVTVAVTQGEAGHEYVKANFKNAKIAVHPGPDEMLTFQDVLTGRADVALGDAYVTAQFAKLHPSQVTDLFADSPYNLTPVSWAVRPADTELLLFLNSSIQALGSQGRLVEFERTAGAHWLHPKLEWQTN